MRRLIEMYLQVHPDSHLATALLVARREDQEVENVNRMLLLSKSLKIEFLRRWRVKFHRFMNLREKSLLKWSQSDLQTYASQSWLIHYQMMIKQGDSNKIKELIAMQRLSIIGMEDLVHVLTVHEDEHSMRINNRVKQLEPVVKHNKSLEMQ